MSSYIKRTAISISFFGETSVGKTCIIRTFLGLEFLETHLSTVGIEKNNSMLKMETGEKIKVKLWDTAGQERFHCISLSTIKNSQGVIVVFDLTNRESFDRVIHWLNIVRDFSKKMPVALFGNKSDLKNERDITKEEIDSLCEKENLVYFETSAKANTGIQEGINKIANLAFKTYEKEDDRKGQQLTKGDNTSKNNKDKKKKSCC